MLTTETTAGRVGARWGSAATSEKIKSIVLGTLRRVGIKLQGTQMRKASGELLQVRTGKLRRALFYQVVMGDTSSYVAAGANLLKAPYGRIHDAGGVINRTGPNGSWSIRIKPTGYIASSLKDDETFINQEVNKATEDIAKEMARASE